MCVSESRYVCAGSVFACSRVGQWMKMSGSACPYVLDNVGTYVYAGERVCYAACTAIGCPLLQNLLGRIRGSEKKREQESANTRTFLKNAFFSAASLSCTSSKNRQGPQRKREEGETEREHAYTHHTLTHHTLTQQRTFTHTRTCLHTFLKNAFFSAGSLSCTSSKKRQASMNGSTKYPLFFRFACSTVESSVLVRVRARLGDVCVIVLSQTYTQTPSVSNALMARARRQGNTRTHAAPQTRAQTNARTRTQIHTQTPSPTEREREREREAHRKPGLASVWGQGSA